MLHRKMLIAIGGAAVLAFPAVASAQRYDDRDGYAPYPRYERRGDYYGAQAGYPQFRGIENHIRREIQEGVRDDLIERDDARDLMAQLRGIQRREQREFEVHGPYLPPDDAQEIRADLDRLDSLVDEIRDEP